MLQSPKTASAPIRRKLIEVALPLEAINAASAREKSIRHGHPSTLHLWWARRPLAACRAVLFAQLVDDPSAWPERFVSEDEQKAERARLHKLIERLVPWEASNDEAVLNEARFEIARSIAWGRGEEPPSRPEAVRAYLLEKAPPVYDPFCGGGSIPLEAQRLGLRAIASDLNPVAVMITKALIEFPPKFAGLPPVNPEARSKLATGGAWNAKGAQGLAEDVRWYGKWIRNEAEKRIGHLYPKATLPDGTEATVIAWLWARTVKCPNPVCACEMPLVGSFMLSTKVDRKVWAEAAIDRTLRPPSIKFAVRSGRLSKEEETALSLGTGYAAKAGKKVKASFRCVACGHGPVSGAYIDSEANAGRINVIPLAVVAEGKRSRIYLPASNADVRAAFQDTQTHIREHDLREEFPRQACRGTFASNAQGRRYGFHVFADYFTLRQLVALTTFSDLVLEARAKALEDARTAGLSPDPTLLADGGTGAQSYADALAVYLAFALSKLADRGSSICTWFTERDSTRNTFARQALPMTWDFAELNMLLAGTGSFVGAAAWTAESLEGTFALGSIGRVAQADASNGAGPPTAIIATDPPYYDNISYADLADFFYVWLRRSLKEILEREFATVLVPKEHELIATPYRFPGGRDEAEQFFMAGMQRAIANMRMASADDVPVTIYYAFRQTEIETEGVVSTGWATFLEAVIGAGFQVDGTWPMRTELSNRMIGRGTNALASSIVLVCRKRPAEAPSVGRSDFLRAMRRELPATLKTLQASTIAPVDMAQASIGPGMAVFSRYAEVLEADDRPMPVRQALMLINQELDTFLAEQEGEFDSYSRFAVGWFEQFGFDTAKYGQAEVMAMGRGTAVQAIVGAGILHAKAGEVRLLKRDELDPAWDIRTDAKVTVWECCQHLIRRLEGEGEESAARLLKTLGHCGDLARDLAYRLYAVCERKGRAEEARAYNGLIVAWPHIARLAEQVEAPPLPGTDERQGRLAV